MMKVYFPQDQSIQVHRSRVKVCPPNFPSGFYWYGGKRRGPDRPPKWVLKVLNSLDSEKETEEPPTGTPESQVEQSLTVDDSRGDDGPLTRPLDYQIVKGASINYETTPHVRDELSERGECCN